LEGSGHGLTKLLSRNFPGLTEVDYENPNQVSRCVSRDSKRAPPEYESRTLRLDHLGL
jgi:hypothetical protein